MQLEMDTDANTAVHSSSQKVELDRTGSKHRDGEDRGLQHHIHRTGGDDGECPPRLRWYPHRVRARGKRWLGRRTPAMAEHPPAVDLAQNVFDGHTGTNHVGRVVHRKKDAGHDLNLQTDAA